MSPRKKDHLKRVRKICLALPNATEKLAWGAPTFRVRDRMFAMFAEHHHGDARVAIWCNAPPGAQEVMVGSEPKRFFRPPYMGARGWVALDLDTNDDEQVAAVLREAYCMVAPKKLRELVEE